MPIVRGKSNTSPLFNSLVRDQVIQELLEEEGEEDQDSVQLETISENDSKILHVHNLICSIDNNDQIQCLNIHCNGNESH